MANFIKKRLAGEGGDSIFQTENDYLASQTDIQFLYAISKAPARRPTL
jgi:hypothetical protein